MQDIVILDKGNKSASILKKNCTPQGYSCAVLQDIDGVKDYFRTSNPNLIFLDLNSQEDDALDIMQYLSSNFVSSQIVFLSDFDDKVLDSAKRIGQDIGLNMAGAIKKPLNKKKIDHFLEDYARFYRPFKKDDIEQGIKKNEFLPFFQPQIDLKTGAVVGVEALARWQHPLKGLVAPDQFIDLAEKTKLIDDLTLDIFKKSIIAQQEWTEIDHHIPVAINLSASTFKSKVLMKKLLDFVEEHKVDPKDVKFEVTESVAMDESLEVISSLTRLRLKGFKISIDDFGTGYSSLVTLHKMPFSELKIDQLFVFDLAKNKDAQTITKCLIDLAHTLGLKTCAEGVENLNSINILRRLGCDVVQGFYYGRPQRQENFLEWLLNYKAEEIFHR